MNSQSMHPTITYLIVLHACSSTAVTKSIGLLPFCLRCLGHLASSSCSMSEKGGLTAPGGERRRLAGGSLQQHLASVVAAVFPGLPPIGGNLPRPTNQPSPFAPTAQTPGLQKILKAQYCILKRLCLETFWALIAMYTMNYGAQRNCHQTYDGPAPNNLTPGSSGYIAGSGVYRRCLATGLNQWCQSLGIKLRSHYLLLPFSCYHADWKR